MHIYFLLAGEVGSIHDACMLRRSPIFARMESASPPFPNNTHIIGDPAYPLKQNLLVAFKNNGHLTRREIRFNRSLSAARSCIERAFALLKGRFRRLKYLDMSDVQKIPYVIIACCVLHNICINLKDDISIESDNREPDELFEYDDNFIALQDRRVGVAKRNVIADNLMR